MIVALSPLLISAMMGYLVLNPEAIPRLKQVLSQQRDEIDSTQRLRLLISSSATPARGFVENGNEAEVQTYKITQTKIAEAFAGLRPEMQRDPELSVLFDKAHQDWIAADSLVLKAVGARRGSNDWQFFARFHQRIVAADEKLAAASERLSEDTPGKQDRAIDLLHLFAKVVLAFAAVSVVAFFVLFVFISQILSGSTKRLVEGARRFASGDRDQEIKVRIPRDFHGVLEELNRSIVWAHESQHALANRANRDGLTELLNRRAFDDTLAALFARKQRFGEQFALLLMDLDHFKSINDTYGHSTGDEVLRVIASRMMTDLRPFDQAFRVGGEEFAVLLSGVDSPAARQVAERLLHAIASHPIPLTVELSVTASIGVVTDAAGSDPTTLYRAADAALYHAKTTGRNRVVVGERAYTSSPEASTVR
jgi:diguanylate cyclase (GGDEF)-like protein